MASSVSMGRVGGVPIRLHWSFLLALPLFAYFIARAYFAEDPGKAIPDAVTLAWGAALAVFLFVSVLLHELGHSLTARSLGMRVQGITLLPIGGVSAIPETPGRPSRELKFTAMGPIVNFVIGIPLVALAWWLMGGDLLALREASDPVKFVWWAGALNLFIGAFNMLVPAFPMDGGRLLRAALATRMGMEKATGIAATVGRGLAILMGIAGFLIGSVLLIAIAFVVWIGAGQEARRVGADRHPAARPQGPG